MKTSNSTNLNRVIMVISATLALGVRAEDLKAKADEAVANFKLADPGLTNFFNKSAGYIILPKVGEAGFFFGGERGDGLVYQDKKLTGKVLMKEYSIGAQVGDASFAEVVFFETKDAMQSFKDAKWTVSAQAKANVAASGAAAGAKYAEGVAVFTLPLGGMMVAATVGGQKFEFKPLK
jgi:lipid-binding SYLF domain-containing protein